MRIERDGKKLSIWQFLVFFKRYLTKYYNNVTIRLAQWALGRAERMRAHETTKICADERVHAGGCAFGCLYACRGGDGCGGLFVHPRIAFYTT